MWGAAYSAVDHNLEGNINQICGPNIIVSNVEYIETSHRLPFNWNYDTWMKKESLLSNLTSTMLRLYQPKSCLLALWICICIYLYLCIVDFGRENVKTYCERKRCVFLFEKPWVDWTRWSVNFGRNVSIK